MAPKNINKVQPKEKEHLMGYQKVRNCRERKRLQLKKDERKVCSLSSRVVRKMEVFNILQERNRLRHLEKRGQKIEILQSEISKDQKLIRSVQGKVESCINTINQKQVEVDSKTTALTKEVKKLKQAIKSVQKYCT